MTKKPLDQLILYIEYCFKELNDMNKFPELRESKVNEIIKKIRTHNYTLDSLNLTLHNSIDLIDINESPIVYKILMDNTVYYGIINTIVEDKLVLMALPHLFHLRFFFKVIQIRIFYALYQHTSNCNMTFLATIDTQG